MDATNLDGIDQTAVTNAVNAADVVIVCIGEETYTEKPGDIDNLDLAAGQTEVTWTLVYLYKIFGDPFLDSCRILHSIPSMSRS